MKVIPPSGLQKIGNTLGKASGFTAFCNPRVESPYISWLLVKESYNISWLLMKESYIIASPRVMHHLAFFTFLFIVCRNGRVITIKDTFD
jgi:hypothetical protein